MQRMSEREKLAYLAGVIDSDGCISFDGRNHPRITITNTRRELLDSLQKQFGGSLSCQLFRNRPAWRPAWLWTLSTTQAVTLLTQLRCWLRLKQEQADLVIEAFYATRNPERNKLTEEQIALRENHQQRMHSLNKRGAA